MRDTQKKKMTMTQFQEVPGLKGSTQPQRPRPGPGPGPGDNGGGKRLFWLGQDRQTEGPAVGTQRFRGPLQNCARVYPVKNARDALRNLKDGVRAISGTRPLTLTRDPCNNQPQCIRPTTDHCLKNQKTLVHSKAVSTKAFFRDSTEVKCRK